MTDAIAEALSDGSSAVTAAIAVAISSAAPEFIWQGLRDLFGHLSWSNLVSTILIAVILVFFVDPILERVRRWLGDGHTGERGRPRHLLVTAAISLLVAMTSVGLHDAMSIFAAGDGSDEGAGVSRAVTITISWGIVPFAVTLAWQSASHRSWAIPIGILAAASSFLAGWYYDWGLNTTMTTAIPCLVIQWFGYRHTGKPGIPTHLPSYAPTLAVAAVAWLAFAGLVDAVVTLSNIPAPTFYDTPDYFIDARFYLGWYLGLLLARQARPTGKPVAA
ncbi:MAG TPA: hypothetical protein VHA07_07505 [Devosia sp.]|nr:hypothetical protein [Devosia sp.]